MDSLLPLLSYNAALLHFYGYITNLYASLAPCPFPPKCVSSSSLVSLSLLLQAADPSFSTIGTHLWSTVGRLRGLRYTVDCLLLSPVHSSGALFHHLLGLSMVLLQKILWFIMEETDFIRGCLQENHAPRTHKSVSFSLALLFCFFLFLTLRFSVLERMI